MKKETALYRKARRLAEKLGNFQIFKLNTGRYVIVHFVTQGIWANCEQNTTFSADELLPFLEDWAKIVNENNKEEALREKYFPATKEIG